MGHIIRHFTEFNFLIISKIFQTVINNSAMKIEIFALIFI